MLGLVRAENQRPVARGLERAGALVPLGDAEELEPVKLAALLREVAEDADRRSAMAVAARAVVDGGGTRRVAGAMLRPLLRLRPVEEGDEELLYTWVNDPEARRSAFLPEPVGWEEHRNWFARRLADGGTLIYIAELPGALPAGQARFEINRDGDAVVDVGVDRNWRGLGLAPALLERATRLLFAGSGAHRAVALVRPENEPSLRAFRRAGYRREGQRSVHGVDAVRFIFDRPAIAEEKHVAQA
jgi:RimJ/RimL family protein N-acetyltransferase